jgi:hypothetical protein
MLIRNNIYQNSYEGNQQQVVTLAFKCSPERTRKLNRTRNVLPRNPFSQRSLSSWAIKNSLQGCILLRITNKRQRGHLWENELTDSPPPKVVEFVFIFILNSWFALKSSWCRASGSWFGCQKRQLNTMGWRGRVISSILISHSVSTVVFTAAASRCYCI